MTSIGKRSSVFPVETRLVVPGTKPRLKFKMPLNQQRGNDDSTPCSCRRPLNDPLGMSGCDLFCFVLSFFFLKKKKQNNLFRPKPTPSEVADTPKEWLRAVHTDIKHMRSLKTKTGLNKREIAQTMKACLIKIGACVESVIAKRKQAKVSKEVKVVSAEVSPFIPSLYIYVHIE